MENAKINAMQLFVLIFLFELGSALLIPLGTDAKQDAWLAILTGMAGGVFLFYIYLRLYKYYPDILPTEYMQILLGKIFGKILACIYIIYFLYISARVLRDFGEMLLTFAYEETPLFIVNALLLLTIVYTVHKGIEVIARTGELLFVVQYFLAVAGFILVIVSGLIDIKNLKPVLESGVMPVVKTFLKETWYIPFGEVVAFIMIFPYINRPKKLKKAGIAAIVLSGVNLVITMAINIAVLGVDLTSRSQFPLLNTIQAIQVAEFLERLDVFFMIALIVGGFIKITIYFYAAVTGVSNLFHVKKASKLAYPLGIVVLILSLSIASSYTEHIQEGLTLVSLYMHLPLQVIIPILLLIIAFFKNKNKERSM
ncbi:GerAB/ArcD/ProY family transporter [Alteribacillus bidgolensis]|uniref:Spore germination protein KB n=1 Tax=Alteribacillus bidgolensis TaxID=930129 RepID=A0A1G8CRI6_9BACI|nr:GerAB/ArcD/ProY family transporter [Alteribacillus bidgolensis]SDH48038.1 spore germination protein KB [Alteribacillus bidgolensis]